jgi:hypothetical protein
VSRSKRVLLLLLAGGAVWALVAIITREREPSYLGKPLRAWLREATYGVGDAGSHDQAIQAIRHMGTNAVPFLLEWIDYGIANDSSHNETRPERMLSS